MNLMYVMDTELHNTFLSDVIIHPCKYLSIIIQIHVHFIILLKPTTNLAIQSSFFFFFRPQGKPHAW